MTVIEENWDEVTPPVKNGREVIYVLIDPRNQEARYVGKTNSNRIRIRLTAHIRDRRPSYKRNWIQSLKALGLEPAIEALEELAINSHSPEWESAERFWISYLRFLGARLTNLTEGGEGLCGHVFTQEHRDKIGRAHLGRIVSAETLARQSESGKKRCHDHLRKLAESQRGKRNSPEHCANKAIAQRGRKHTPETIARMSAAALGRKATKETRERMSQAQRNRSPEWQEKLSKSKRGIKLSPKHCAALSLARLGRKHSPESIALMSFVHKKRHAESRSLKGVT